MGFLECSFSPPVWLLRKSISGKHFFFWATEWALKYRGPMGPVEPTGLGGGESVPRKKIRLVNEPGPGNRSWPVGWIWVLKNPAQTPPIAIPSSNITYDSSFVTLGGSLTLDSSILTLCDSKHLVVPLLFFFSHFRISSSHCAVPTSHMTVILSY